MSYRRSIVGFVCRFGMPSVIHSDQGREFDNKVMHVLCHLGGSHKTKTTPYHLESDGLVERFNWTLLMMLAMFTGEHKDDWDDLLPPVMMAYRSSVHESTGFSLYRFMFGEECTLPIDIGLPRQQPDPQEGSRACMLSGLRTRWRWCLIKSVDTRVRLYSDRNNFMISGRFDTCLRLATV